MEQKNIKSPLAQDDWDFRKIEPWETGFAVYHEFARECPSQMLATSSIITIDWIKANTAKSVGLKIALAQLVPKFGVGCCFAAFQQAAFHLTQQQSWLQQNAQSRELLRASFGPTRSLCHIEDFRKFDGSTWDEIIASFCSAHTYGTIEQTTQWELLSQFRSMQAYTLRIDWEAVRSKGGIDGLLKELRPLLHTMQPLGHSQSGRPKMSMDTLSSLAAWRLNRAGVSWAEANELIKKLAPPKGRGLPDYTTEKGWRLAIKRADEFLEEFLNLGK